MGIIIIAFIISCGCGSNRSIIGSITMICHITTSHFTVGVSISGIFNRLCHHCTILIFINNNRLFCYSLHGSSRFIIITR